MGVGQWGQWQQCGASGGAGVLEPVSLLGQQGKPRAGEDGEINCRQC